MTLAHCLWENSKSNSSYFKINFTAFQIEQNNAVSAAPITEENDERTITNELKMKLDAERQARNQLKEDKKNLKQKLVQLREEHNAASEQVKLLETKLSEQERKRKEEFKKLNEVINELKVAQRKKDSEMAQLYGTSAYAFNQMAMTTSTSTSGKIGCYSTKGDA